MLTKLANRTVASRILHRLKDFKSREDGNITIFSLMTFFLMVAFGGIAVDVMRFETRRVTMQETMDRAVLAAASLTQPDSMSPKAIADDWFAKAGLGDQLTVSYSFPTVSVYKDSTQKVVTATAKVRSYNWFMGLMNVGYLEGPTSTEAAQGVSQIEVMLALDITGSMNDPASTTDTTSKITALRAAATDFVNLVKANDTQNGVSIGIVPYSSQVNIPVALRQQFTGITNISYWDGVANAGVQSPNINCVEIPTSTFTSTALSTSTPMSMAAVADTTTGMSNSTNYLAATGYVPQTAFGPRNCTTKTDDTATAVREDQYNLLYLPTKDKQPVLDRIAMLTAGGNTSIAVGMRWATALLDQSARDIYTAVGDASVKGRPADNSDVKTRKIIVLMTDGEHVQSTTITDAFKWGPSPIWRGATDGRFAMRFTTGLGALNANTRPACAGTNTYFIPHLKTNTTTACQAAAWAATPTWTGSGTVRQLDWSEVWRYLRPEYVVRQMYMRSNVANTTDYTTLINMFIRTYIDAGTMNTLLQQNCKAARDAGFEIYGIAFAAPANGQTQIKNCASPDSTQVIYYYNASNNAALTAAFKQIATQIADLRLTQ